ncbi:SAM-dependent methyltransferase [Alkalilimnicola sp. S0819]|uniref:SAM-dependent methyltransferase n=1 Tax=Alkalilimnicola sp. S0819 TaxID=2613922 RepID=UPI0012615CB7|nr:cyclopropane-fatty-acyl-phospholipid synthase family protein [Alkalilimnicola sp. S0819]KAB7623023.1 class I SAM-dependent methyltransferase [Alkalilimnicola sp. S0819]MPQ17135.1 methyltransferase domain-containing protein [Alkalilimnicola sp. S0819]
MVVEKRLEEGMRVGSLRVLWPNGRARTFGEGAPRAEWVLHRPEALKRVAADPHFMLGQTYMDGDWSAGEGGLPALLEVLMRNLGRPPGRSGWRKGLSMLLKPLQQWNRAAASRRNVSHHYDLDESLFRRFLDEDMQYSCAYFARPEMSLEAAQRAKVEHIRRKLLLEPGQRVLDIGCGWGGLAIYLAEQGGARVTGLTLSKEQARVARQRVRERGLEGQVEILLEDYREHDARYDRVVSVGMFEHVGVPYYDTYFSAVRERLTEEGIALIHTIGRSSPPGLTNAWIRRYIFPGGYIPAMSEMAAAVERSGLVTADVEVLRLHYARTLAQWLERFGRVREQVAAEKDERFCRMWEFYLAACEASFRFADLVVFHFQLSRALAAVPVTRDYLYEEPAPEAGRARVAG